MAITFDDLPGVLLPEEGSAELATLTDRLVGVLAAQRIPAIGFVNSGKLAPDGTVNPGRVALLRRWLDAGLELGNHTYSHCDLHAVGLEAFEADVVRGEETLRPLLEARGLALRYFRHPFLHTGRSLETRRALEAFLRRRGYRVAPVTVDNSDWIFARAYARARSRGDAGAAQAVAEAYVPYMLEKVLYFRRQSAALFGREIPQILLVHASGLNADRFGDLARGLRAQGYEFVSLGRALEDPAYGSPDTFLGPGGISWLHRWALTRGKSFVLPDEPRAPRVVMEASGVSEE